MTREGRGPHSRTRTREVVDKVNDDGVGGRDAKYVELMVAGAYAALRPSAEGCLSVRGACRFDASNSGKASNTPAFEAKRQSPAAIRP